MSMRLAWTFSLGAALGILLGATVAGADEPATNAERATPPPVATPGPYIPPSPERPTPEIRTTGGTRGIEASLPDISLLVPQHLAQTVNPQPLLYWMLSEESPVRIVLTIAVTDDDSVTDPILEIPAEAPTAAGLHALRLADHGVRLRPGKSYEWSVAVVPDANRRAGDRIARGFVRVVDPYPALHDDLKGLAGNPAAQSRAYAGHGMWYDALATLSEALLANPEDADLRLARKQLLSQVGLEVPAYGE